jgi:predicted nucleotidyltransferase
MLSILAKDFVETSESLIFAVVESGFEQEKVLCFLRYIGSGNRLKKVNTEQANQFLADKYPHYLYYSANKQAHCHALVLADIFKHHQPRAKLNKLLLAGGADEVENDCVQLCRLFEQHGMNLNDIGVTGSILISAHKSSSDIDLVFYSREVFNQARQITQQLIMQGDCSELTDDDWLESYDRRSCDLSYSEYVWHEKRKFNKALINQRKFDLSLVNATEQSDSQIAYEKIEAIVLNVKIMDDSLSFDYPAEFEVDHPQIKSIVCYTATYTGQAKTGEWVEVAGFVEQSADGGRRIVVGSSREAKGEYIKVINEPAS